MVAIDSKYMFLGGMDLCFGRWEYHGYPLSEPVENKTYFYGKDFVNTGIKQIDEVEKWEDYSFDKNNFPRQPWHDLQIRISGPVVNGIKRHFIQLWNFIKNSQSINTFLEKRDPIEIQHTKENYERWKHFNELTYNSKEHHRNSYSKIYADSAKKNAERLAFGLLSSKYRETPTETACFDIQGLRSACYWSVGTPVEQTETSIYKAFIETIRKAEHYIYIENQYFISNCGDKDVSNEIGNEIAQKVIDKIVAKQKFLVIILIPLLPDLGGNLIDADGSMMRKGYNLVLKTFTKSEESLIKRVEKVDKNWQNYIHLLGMKTHSIINEQPVSEPIYVHSKLLIVDDKICIIGSANINDRSLKGTTDSELDVIMSESNKVKGYIQGVEVMKSPSIQKLRERCWRNLFGFKETDFNIEDPFNPEFLKYMKDQVEINDEFYWKSFGLFPHNSFKTIKETREAYEKNKTNTEYYMANKHLVRGYAISWPISFLCDEDLDRFDDLSIQATLIPKNIFM
jgi:phospholipase D1/2